MVNFKNNRFLPHPLELLPEERTRWLKFMNSQFLSKQTYPYLEFKFW